jgi:glycerol-3-phosphate acyltransferase PlsY
VFLALSPLAVAVALGVYLVLMLVWRYVSLGSVSAAAVMPIAVWGLGGGRTLTVVTMLISVVVIIRHIENIRRLVAGTESRFKA